LENGLKYNNLINFGVIIGEMLLSNNCPLSSPPKRSIRYMRLHLTTSSTMSLMYGDPVLKIVQECCNLGKKDVYQPKRQNNYEKIPQKYIRRGEILKLSLAKDIYELEPMTFRYKVDCLKVEL
jgi:hypothetical protein